MSGRPASAPRRLGRYEVVAEIARGGMGTVYLARRAGEAGFQRLFAIKLMHPHLEEDRQFVDMLLDEARIAARIHHPNVVAILDLGREEGHHFVVLEYVDGAAFSVLLTRSKEARPPELIVPIMVDTLEGLEAAHTLTDDDGQPLHLVHRDVSPQNILVGADGIGRITDFGIAKAEARITSTRPGIRKGKIHYMAPEQLTEDGDHIDRRADVFAAGAVLWGSLTGRSLFRGQNEAATVHNVLSKEVPPPSTVGFKPPSVFDAVCLRALERDPEKRFQSALEMADALRRAAAAHGLVSSHSAIASWVGETLGDELEARRQAIRTVASRSHHIGSTDSLPELPTLPPVSAGALSPTYPNSGASLDVVIQQATPISQTQPTVTSHSLSVEPMPGLHAGRRRALIVGGALLVPLLIGGTWLATRSSGDREKTAQSSSSAAAPTAPAEPTPKASENAEPPVPADTEASAAPVESTPEPAHKPRHVARAHRHAKTPPKATPAASAALKPSSAPPPATAKPPSNLGTGVQFERNPYLRK